MRATWLAPRGVMNVFAGVARGTMAPLDLSDAYLKQARVIGHSASSIDDLRFMLLPGRDRHALAQPLGRRDRLAGSARAMACRR